MLLWHDDCLMPAALMQQAKIMARDQARLRGRAHEPRCVGSPRRGRGPRAHAGSCTASGDFMAPEDAILWRPCAVFQTTALRLLSRRYFLGLLRMTTLEITLSLPESVAKEAEAAGLLTPEALETMLRERLRARRIAELRDAVNQITAAGGAPMTMEEIEAEIRAYRQERRRASGA